MKKMQTSTPKRILYCNNKIVKSGVNRYLQQALCKHVVDIIQKEYKTELSAILHQIESEMKNKYQILPSTGCSGWENRMIYFLTRAGAKTANRLDMLILDNNKKPLMEFHYGARSAQILECYSHKQWHWQIRPVS